MFLQLFPVLTNYYELKQLNSLILKDLQSQRIFVIFIKIMSGTQSKDRLLTEVANARVADFLDLIVTTLLALSIYRGPEAFARHGLVVCFSISSGDTTPPLLNS